MKNKQLILAGIIAGIFLCYLFIINSLGFLTENNLYQSVSFNFVFTMASLVLYNYLIKKENAQIGFYFLGINMLHLIFLGIIALLGVEGLHTLTAKFIIISNYFFNVGVLIYFIGRTIMKKDKS